MKSPEYVATVTKIYRKYIDLAMSNEPYIIDPNDKKELLQVFNRGMFSSGHFSNAPNKNLVFKDKPNHMGLFLGTVQKYNKNKGYITLKLKEPINIGDKVSVEKESGSYTISELMENKNNIRETKVNQIVTIGRIKSSISSGDKVYKISSKYITTTANESYKSENRKVSLNCNVIIKKSCPVTIKITSCNDLLEYKNLDITYQMPYIPEDAKNRPLDKETIIRQISKTNSTPYKFKNIKIDLDENVYLPKLSILNELRRISLENVVDYAISQIHRTYTSPSSNINKNDTIEDMRIFAQNKTNLSNCIPPKISVLLNIINLDFDYSKLKDIDNLYIPLKYFINKKYENILKTLTKKFDTYIYLPTILKGNYKNLFYSNAKNTVQNYKIKGFVISNIGNIKLLHDLFTDLNTHFKVIANYTFNVFNSNSVLELKKLDISKFTLSPESDKNTLLNLCNYNYLQKELIVYGKIPLLNMNYCLLGETDLCYPNCKQRCQSSHVYELKDRLNMKFKILPDNIQTVTTIFNSKITSIAPKGFDISHQRIDILEESIEEINDIIEIVTQQKRLEGQEYTNGNLNKTI